MADRIGLRQLRAFHAVMVTGSIGAAAERLNLTQPAISKQLSGLEHALDIRLFNRRSGRETTPTQEGVDYYKAIETTIAGLEDLAPIARTIRERGRKRIRFAATPPVMNSARLMSALHRFLAAHPDTHMSLEVRHRMDIEDWVAARQIDADQRGVVGRGLAPEVQRSPAGGADLQDPLGLELAEGVVHRLDFGRVLLRLDFAEVSLALEHEGHREARRGAGQFGFQVTDLADGRIAVGVGHEVIDEVSHTGIIR